MAPRKKPMRRRAAAAKDENRIPALIAEATVDAHDESEQAMGFWDALHDELALPFNTKVLGVEVVVQDIGMTDDDQLQGDACRRRADGRRPACVRGRRGRPRPLAVARRRSTSCHGVPPGQDPPGSFLPAIPDDGVASPTSLMTTSAPDAPPAASPSRLTSPPPMP
ncbi:MAG: hypothetical protein HY905_02330 [Deltaproteobacteria bacterium]|nr:hypothetical protein [Deltaproteobacteria bacterium]